MFLQPQSRKDIVMGMHPYSPALFIIYSLTVRKISSSIFYGVCHLDILVIRVVLFTITQQLRSLS